MVNNCAKKVAFKYEMRCLQELHYASKYVWARYGAWEKNLEDRKIDSEGNVLNIAHR